MRPRTTKTTTQQRATAWLVLVAVVLVAIGPLLALARGGVPPMTWTEVCSAQGTRVVAMNGAAASPSPTAAPVTTGDDDRVAPELPGGMTHPLQHCPWCAIEHPVAALPPFQGALLIAAPFSASAPRAFLRAARTLHAWAPAQARAPPSGDVTAIS